MDATKTSETPESKLHFLDYWRIIRLRKTVILAVFLLVLITTTVVTLFLQEIFSSKVRISIEKDMTTVKGIDWEQNNGAYDPFWLQTQFEKIKSQSVLDEVIKKHQLQDVWTKRYNLEQKLRTEEVRKMLQKKIRLSQPRNTSLIEIEVFSENKDEAATLANAVADSYRDTRTKQRKELRSDGVEKLKEQLKLKDLEVLRAQAVINQMRFSNNIPDIMDGLQGTITLRTETLRQLEQQKNQADFELLTFSSLLKKLKALTPEERRISMVTAYPDPQLSSLSETLALNSQRLTGMMQDLTEENPEVKRLLAVYKKTEELVNEKISGMMIGLETKVQYQRERFETIEAKVRNAEADDIRFAAIYRPYFDAKRHLEGLQRVRDGINLRIEQELLDLSLPTTGIVTVWDKAEPALQPEYPKIPKNIALGAIVGLIVGVGLAFFIEYLDTSVKTIDDVERALQAPVLGVIPQNVGSLLDEGPESPHAEAYRVLRTNVLFSRKNNALTTLTVISGGAGEGKSTTLFNLAVIFAQNGHRVLLVDSDLRRPSIHKILQLSNSIGLTNLLLKQNTIEEVIQTTTLPTLDFLPSGKLPSSSMGILSSLQMKELIRDLKSRYDFVFLDSPPIMGVSDASILASEVDMVLQVIQYRRYPQPMTIRAKQMILKVGGNLLGIVLNNINMSQDENYYYYSGYYHDYYSKQDEEEGDKKSKAAKKVAKDQAKLEIKGKF